MSNTRTTPLLAGRHRPVSSCTTSSATWPPTNAHTGPSVAAGEVDDVVVQLVRLPVRPLLAVEAAGLARHVERAHAREGRKMAHRDVGDPVLEAGGVHPALDVVRGPIGRVYDERAAPNRLGDCLGRPEHAPHRRHADLGVEPAKSRPSDGGLRPADVVGREQDLAVQVAELDGVSVHQRQLADPAAGEAQRRPAAEPAHAEHEHARLAEAQLAIGRRQAVGRDVGEVSELAVVAAELGGAQRVVRAGVLHKPLARQQLEHLVDRRGAELRGQHPALRTPVEPLDELAPARAGALEHEIRVGARTQQADVATGRAEHLGGGLETRSSHVPSGGSAITGAEPLRIG